MTLRRCSKCHHERPPEMFSKSSNTKDGLRRWCKLCEKEYRHNNRDRYRAYTTEWNNKNRERARQTRNEWRKKNRDRVYSYELKSVYGISLEIYEQILANQGGRCAICRKEETVKYKNGTIRRLALDHDHACCPTKTSCGKCIRGLLCYICNTTLGKLNDDVSILENAIEYLTKTKEGAR